MPDTAPLDGALPQIGNVPPVAGSEVPAPADPDNTPAGDAVPVPPDSVPAGTDDDARRAAAWEAAEKRRFLIARRQGEELRRSLPDFDFARELENPRFERLVMGAGVSVEDAYRAIHHAAIEEEIRRRTREDVARSIGSGAARPAENGAVRRAASVSAAVPDAEMRRELKKRIYSAAAQGKKIYP